MSEPESCEKCGTSFKGEPIPDAERVYYGRATHFSRIIGISDGDSVGWWSCPDCGHRWERAGAYAEQARRNMARG